MKLRRVAILGGGPGGLYTARLLKLSDPDCQVDVYEQSDREHTFGFGVGLAAGPQRRLAAADADTAADILAAGFYHDMRFQVGSASASMPSDSVCAIARTALLSVLERRAVAVGVELHVGTRQTADEVDADLVIAADGAGSATRTARRSEFGEQVQQGRGLYLWCGTNFALPSAVFVPVSTDDGTFVAHAYPYAQDRSTFLIETDEETWRRAGFDHSTAATLPQDSDQAALTYLEEAFAAVLQGHPLVGNRTRWLRFRTVRCDRWSWGNTVLLGDAAHTAHYSVGSGTRLAMEDGIALVAALAESPNIESAFGAYEDVRRPVVEHLQDVAARSQRWWDTFPARSGLAIHRLLISYLTRGGKVSVERLLDTNPSLLAAAMSEYAHRDVSAAELSEPEQVLAWILDQPGPGSGEAVGARTGSVIGSAVDVWVTSPPQDDDGPGPGTPAANPAVVRLDGPPDRASVLDRLEQAERLRWRSTTGQVIVRGSASNMSDLAAGLLAGRTDLVDLTG